MQKHCILTIFPTFAFILLVSSACSGSNISTGQTAGQLSAAGKTIFQQRCEKCHGENGQKVPGSPILGQDNVLANYQTGQGLYDYISKLMPDDNPGSLSPAQYLQVESYLLLQDGYVQSGTPVDQNNLDRILLEKH